MTSLRCLAPILVLAGLTLLPGCGDDADVAAAPTPTVPVEAGTDDPTAPLDVRAVDYEFEGLPPSIPAGTPVSLTNDSDTELHELIAIRLPDDEDRAVEELLALPEEELEPFFAGVTDVIVALPGETDTPGAVEGDGQLSEAGRYAFICFIPVGADPQAYIAAAQSGEEPDATGPPHFTVGMFAEAIVE